MTVALPTSARLLASARWPFPREDMTEPGLVVWRLAEDMADLFDTDADPGVEALVALGWPRHLVAQYFEPASHHCAALVAARLDERRRHGAALRESRPIPLEPREATNDNERGRCEPEGSRSMRARFEFGFLQRGLGL